MTKFFAVVLQQNRMIVVKETWIKNPIVGQNSKVYISNDEQSVPDFSLRPIYLLNTSIDACYNGRIIKKFEYKEDAEHFASWKRPQYYDKSSKRGKNRFNFEESTVVAKINIDVSNQFIVMY